MHRALDRRLMRLASSARHFRRLSIASPIASASVTTSFLIGKTTRRFNADANPPGVRRGQLQPNVPALIVNLNEAKISHSAIRRRPHCPKPRFLHRLLRHRRPTLPPWPLGGSKRQVCNRVDSGTCRSRVLSNHRSGSSAPHPKSFPSEVYHVRNRTNHRCFNHIAVRRTGPRRSATAASDPRLEQPLPSAHTQKPPCGGRATRFPPVFGGRQRWLKGQPPSHPRPRADRLQRADTRAVRTCPSGTRQPRDLWLIPQRLPWSDQAHAHSGPKAALIGSLSGSAPPR